MADDGQGAVNVWFDNPGNFLEIYWGQEGGTGNYPDETTVLDPTLFLTAAGQVVGFHILGALNDRREWVDETYIINEVQSHPLSVRYDRRQDLWRAQWGPAVMDCVATPNPRIKALVDAAGQIQGVEIRDLRTFEGEILNQNLYPAELGVKAGQS